MMGRMDGWMDGRGRQIMSEKYDSGETKASFCQILFRTFSDQARAVSFSVSGFLPPTSEKIYMYFL